MSNELSDAIRDSAVRLLGRPDVPASQRRLLEARDFDRALWAETIQLGWPGLIVPEAFGGLGLGIDTLAVLAEEVGRSAASVPLTATAAVAHALTHWGSEAQQGRWLPGLAEGRLIGSFGFAVTGEQGLADGGGVSMSGGRLEGRVEAVAFGAVADLLLVPVAGELAILEFDQPAVEQQPFDSLDNSRAHAAVVLAGAAAELLVGSRADALLDHLALVTAFEQIGGAEACLDAARAYALQRHAFGQPIARFQAVKHRLVEIYARIEVARGAARRAIEQPDPRRSAAARLGASEAYGFAAQESIQIHGGIGVMWEMDCHLHYRRARVLELELGSRAWWEDRLVDRLVAAGAGA